MITVAVTGRSGCGKSTVTACFAAHGVPVADADALSREILQPGSPVLAELAERFGQDGPPRAARLSNLAREGVGAGPRRYKGGQPGGQDGRTASHAAGCQHRDTQ